MVIYYTPAECQYRTYRPASIRSSTLPAINQLPDFYKTTARRLTPACRRIVCTRDEPVQSRRWRAARVLLSVLSVRYNNAGTLFQRVRPFILQIGSLCYVISSRRNTPYACGRTMKSTRSIGNNADVKCLQYFTVAADDSSNVFNNKHVIVFFLERRLVIFKAFSICSGTMFYRHLMYR